MVIRLVVQPQGIVVCAEANVGGLYNHRVLLCCWSERGWVVQPQGVVVFAGVNVVH